MDGLHPRRTGARRGTRRRPQVAATRRRGAPASAHPGRRTAQAVGRGRLGQNQSPNGRAVRGHIDRGDATLVDTHVSAHNDARKPGRLTRSPMATKASRRDGRGKLIRADPSGRHDDSDGYGGIGATTSLAGRIGANTGQYGKSLLQAFYMLCTAIAVRTCSTWCGVVANDTGVSSMKYSIVNTSTVG